MTISPQPGRATWKADCQAGLVVFLVALPLCLGVAILSGAPPISGILAGIIGGVLVGALSGSHTSVSGPAAGLTAVVAAQLASLGSFPAFLLALLIAGGIQILFGLFRAGRLAQFIPVAVINGLLAAIGLLLILKQIPHLLGNDADPEGDSGFEQPDQLNTFSEIAKTISDIHWGVLSVSLISLAVLIVWDKFPKLKKSVIPAPLVVVGLGVLLGYLFGQAGTLLRIEKEHFVEVPVPESLVKWFSFLQLPDWSGWNQQKVWLAGLTIAIVASLETLLNLQAVDKLDPYQRISPPNRELFAQGVGNIGCALVGGIPVTSVIVRSSANINAGAKTKLSAVWHGLLLWLSVLFCASLLNQIPVASLAAILLLTGYKLIHPKIIFKVYKQGWSQFLPFVVTIIAIVRTDLLIGVLIGLGVSILFIARNTLQRPLRQISEKHLGEVVTRIILSNQVHFLNRAKLTAALDSIPTGGHAILDARNTDSIDPDVLALIEEYVTHKAPARKIQISLIGFKDWKDTVQFVYHSTKEVQKGMTPAKVLSILEEGNQRFRNNQQLLRDYQRQIDATKSGQYPLAVVLSCIDSRTPTELIFDLGLGDIFTVRIAGNVAKEKVLGSMEYACAVAGAKLAVVLGHTHCGAVRAAVDLYLQHQDANSATGCEHLDALVNEIQRSITPEILAKYPDPSEADIVRLADEVCRNNVVRTLEYIRTNSGTIRNLAKSGQIQLIGGLYDIETGLVEFFNKEPSTAQ